MDDPFAPPTRTAPASSGAATQGVVVVGAWGVAAAIGGAALGAWLGGDPPVVAPFGVAGAMGGAVFGGIAFGLERWVASGRKALVDRRGRLVRPLSTWLHAVPLAVGVLAVGALVALWSQQTRSSTPATAFAIVGVVGAVVIRPMLARRALTAAVTAIEQGETDRARRRLVALESGLLATRSVREVARLNLGILAIQAHETDEAAAWFQRAGSSAHAATGLALVRAVQGRFDEAEALINVANRADDNHHALAEIDGVKLLVVLRRDGAAAARRVGEARLHAHVGALFQAVLAAARSGDGDHPGAEVLLADEAVQATIDAGVGVIVPELQALRWR